MTETPVRKVRVDTELWEAAKTAAEANGENVAVVIRRALIQYVNWNQAKYSAEQVGADQETMFTPDGAGGGHFQIPRGIAHPNVKENQS